MYIRIAKARPPALFGIKPPSSPNSRDPQRMTHHLRFAAMLPSAMRALPTLFFALALIWTGGGSASAQSSEQLGDPTRQAPIYNSGKDADSLPQCAPGQADPDHTGCRPIEWIIQDEEMAAESDAPVPTAGSSALGGAPSLGGGSSLGADSPSESSGSSGGDSPFGGGGSSSGSRSKSPF